MYQHEKTDNVPMSMEIVPHSHCIFVIISETGTLINCDRLFCVKLRLFTPQAEGKNIVMAERLIWVERKFSFDLPVWMFPNVLERIRGTPSRLEDRVRNLSHETLIRKPNEKWSVQEQAGHLLDLESLNLQRMDEYDAGLETLTPADVSNRQTHEAGYNQKSIDSILSDFRNERSRFVKRLESADESLIERVALHPRLKTPMRLIDYAYFIAEHDDHHLARISDLLR